MEADRAHSEIAEHFASHRELIDAIPAGAIATGRRLVVIDAPLRGVGHYGWIDVSFREDPRLAEIPPSERVANMLGVVTQWPGWQGPHQHPARAAAATLREWLDLA